MADMARPEWVSGNIYIRPNRLKEGEVVSGHTHHFDHTTIFFTGTFRVEATLPGGAYITRLFQAPAHCLIRADVKHEITALTDGEFWCVYSHRDPQGRITQVYTGWPEAYC